jgi:hypothetical protein
MKNTLFVLLAYVLTSTCPVLSQEKLINKGEIPIVAWYGIPHEETTLQRYMELKESGITYDLSYFPNADSMEMALDVAQKARIKLFIDCPELKTNTEETVKRFMKHPAIAGYMLRDEPSRSDFPKLGEWVRKIRAIDDTHFCYLNLFPNYANEQQLGTKTYQEHVDLFVAEVPVQILSFDHYPVVGDSLRANYYENLEIISEAARKAVKPFWAFSLSVAHGPYPVPTIPQMSLQVYSDLAYGAQGIQYFTYWTPPMDTTWKFNRGPITQDGKRTQIFDRIKVINNEIRNLSGVFLNARVISVAHTGDPIPFGTKPLVKLPEPIKVLKTEGTGAVVSVLENGPDSYLVVVNRDFIKPMNLTIDCDPTVKKVLKDGTLVPASAYNSTIEIDPGDVAIYRWQTR